MNVPNRTDRPSMEGLPRDLTQALELYARSPDPVHLRMVFEALEGAQALLPLEGERDLEGEGFRELGPGVEREVRVLEREAERLLPVFSEPDALASWAGGTRYLAVQGLDVVRLALREGYDGLVFDAGTGRESRIGREPLEALAAGLPEAPYSERPDIYR
jgi:hypothetical protein